jgi:hypothetical protein
MMNRRIAGMLFLVSLLALSAIAAAPAVSGSSTPEAAAKAFYAEKMKRGVDGLPDAKQLDRLRPFFSTKLRKAIDAAIIAQKKFIEKNPDDKPPLIEGDLFSSLFEGPTSFEAGAATLKGATARVPVHFTYKDPGDPSHPQKWTDTLVLVKENGKWLVDDVEYGGTWDFASKGKLTDALEHVE